MSNQDPWNDPAWRKAAEDYHRDRPATPALELIASKTYVCDICGNAPCGTRGFCGYSRAVDRQTKRRARLAEQQSVPQTTVEAIIYSVRQRGIAALEEPVNVWRLSRCDEAALAEIKRRILKLGERP